MRCTNPSINNTISHISWPLKWTRTQYGPKAHAVDGYGDLSSSTTHITKTYNEQLH